jgi:hypothetical protein
MKETALEVFGPVKITPPRDGLKKHITDETIAAFWEEPVAMEMAGKQGCYIFALHASKGFTPWYVGRATKTFKQEIFHSEKLKKYNKLLWDGKKGSPVMFFVALPGNLKKIPVGVINDMEKFLIQSAVLKNKNVLNTHNTKNLPEWSIKGVVRASQGKPSAKSLSFKTMMGL